jgi:hypothetical protein
MLGHSFRRVRGSLLGALSVAALAGAALATTVIQLDFAGLTHLSTNVIVGQVAQASSAWTPDGATIVTRSAVTVGAQWKGDTGASSIVVRTPGGQVGEQVIEVAGSPVLRQGDSVLLFLERNEDGSYGVISLAQGSFRVSAAEDGSFWVARDPEASHLVAVGPQGSGAVQAVDLPLAEVRSAVDAALAVEAAGPVPEPVTGADNLVPMTEVKGGAR